MGKKSRRRMTGYNDEEREVRAEVEMLEYIWKYQKLPPVRYEDKVDVKGGGNTRVLSKLQKESRANIDEHKKVKEKSVFTEWWAISS